MFTRIIVYKIYFKPLIYILKYKTKNMRLISNIRLKLKKEKGKNFRLTDSSGDIKKINWENIKLISIEIVTLIGTITAAYAVALTIGGGFDALNTLRARERLKNLGIRRDTYVRLDSLITKGNERSKSMSLKNVFTPGNKELTLFHKEYFKLKEIDRQHF